MGIPQSNLCICKNEDIYKDIHWHCAIAKHLPLRKLVNKMWHSLMIKKDRVIKTNSRSIMHQHASQNRTWSAGATTVRIPKRASHSDLWEWSPQLLCSAQTEQQSCGVAEWGKQVEVQKHIYLHRTIMYVLSFIIVLTSGEGGREVNRIRERNTEHLTISSFYLFQDIKIWSQ